MNIHIRALDERDPIIISQAFTEQGWDKPVELYLRYLEEQKQGTRVSLVAEEDHQFAGYVNVLWHSHYPFFQDQGIPEINDFNVLLKYRRQGIGSMLMNRAEEVIKERSAVAGIGVGLFSDYGHAQILYAKRGYVPDGQGIYDGHGHKYLRYGDPLVVNDDVALYLTKSLT
ncbi:GNAT family N-acetyltransferase [Paenibacillus chibensis]|uniref:GNAT family N-acetyltransferase n=1 Tax=Paenibacillus chibensis TaxID=59846 RepID=UPI000FDAE776|nr:GNAT family N-acetyltransferase [Paenibacillus chibensis]MEC0370611.1 GNAT family N-acetyltransferase [Paenibacillus chibensis]